MFALLVLLSQSQLATVSEERAFLHWMRSTNNIFTGTEYQLRLAIFLTTMRYVNDFNRASHKFTLSLNHLSALTPTEYRAMLGVLPGSPAAAEAPAKATVSAPDSIDWREKNVVNPIKDQAQCGSCWSFSAIQTAESASAIRSGTLIAFSESNLIDCCTKCFGCSGGWPYAALDYILDQQGGQFMSESDYPYAPIQRSCAYDKTKRVGLITDYYRVKNGSEDELKEKVATYGPASVCVDASPASFQQYSSGIYESAECWKVFLNHGVGCVGYGAEGADEYWIIRNSWGAEWGEQGYMRLARNKDNMCGVASDALVAFTRP